MSELPEGWTKSDLGSIAEIYQPETISKAKLVPDGDYPVYGANGPIGRYDRYNHEEPELLVTCRGATCGAVNISEPKSWINGNAMVVRLDRQLVDFRFSEAFFRGACDYSGVISGSAQPQITRQSLSPVHFPIPPLPEQRRIVAKLDRFSARSAAARDHLARTTKLATRAKQAILAEAFPNTESVDKTQPKRVEFSPIKEVASVQLGKMLDKAKNRGSEVEYLGNINVRWFGFELDALKKLRADPADIEKFNINDGDLLVCEGGEPGRCAIWRKGPTELIFQKALMRVRCGKRLSVQYLQYWLFHQASSGALNPRFTGTTIKHLPKRALEGLLIPVPSISDQAEIVRRIETAFARIDRMTNEASRAAHLLDRLDERLLAKAFRGELVPQDPEDEPAEALLARIRQSRAAVPKPKRGRRSLA